MNSTRNYITSEIKKRVPMFIAIMILAGMVALNIFVPEPVLEPDSVHPFVNVRVDWQQTYYAGAWSDAE